MNERNLSDQELLRSGKEIAKREREILIEALRHLREVDRRKLFCTLKLGSLFDYATKELGYSEDQAYRRINTMRLMRDLPEVEQKLETGSLTLAGVSLVTSAIRAEQKATPPLHGESTADTAKAPRPPKTCHRPAVSPARKLELINAVEGKSKPQAERAIQALIGAPLPRPETAKAYGHSIELRSFVPQSTMNVIHRLKGLWAHSHPNLSTGDLITLLCNRALEQELNSRMPDTTKSAKSRTLKKPWVKSVFKVPAVTPASRHIAASIRRSVWQEGQGECHNCGSRWALEVDHIRPFASGGQSAAENLRVLCRPCNQRAAIETLGLARIEAARAASANSH